MNDRELLELAAKAAEIEGKYYCGFLNDDWVDGIVYIRTDGQQCVWDPLTDDGDALRLAVKLKLCVAPYEYVTNQHTWVEVPDGTDPYAAARRAIVRAAAEIARCNERQIEKELK